MKVTPAEVLDRIEQSGRITVEELAAILDVTPDTVRKKLRILRGDGEKILFDSDGLFLLPHVESEADATAVRNYLQWLIGVARSIIICGKPTKPLLLEAKKSLRATLTSDERKLMANNMVMLTRLIDYISMDEEMEA
jgi:DNA-binding MarR family transcriptional regulator